MKEKWTKADYEMFVWIILIILMIALIPVIISWDWLQYAHNWRRVLNSVNWLLNKALEMAAQLRLSSH